MSKSRRKARDIYLRNKAHVEQHGDRMHSAKLSLYAKTQDKLYLFWKEGHRDRTQAE